MGENQINFKHKKFLLAVVLVVIAASVAGTLIILGAKTDNSVSSDAESYAEHHGVTVDETTHRFSLQREAGLLDAELSSKEAETFAGLWIEHTPEFRIVVQFTHDAEETIRPYLHEDLLDIVEVRTAKESLIDLQRAQSDILSSLRSLGIPVDSAIDVRENRVKVYTADRIRFDDALRDGKLILPDSVDVITVEGLAKPN